MKAENALMIALALGMSTNSPLADGIDVRIKNDQRAALGALDDEVCDLPERRSVCARREYARRSALVYLRLQRLRSQTAGRRAHGASVTTDRGE